MDSSGCQPLVRYSVIILLYRFRLSNVVSLIVEIKGKAHFLFRLRRWCRLLSFLGSVVSLEFQVFIFVCIW